MLFITYDPWAFHVRDAFVEPVLMPEVLVVALALGLWRFLRRRNGRVIRPPLG